MDISSLAGCSHAFLSISCNTTSTSLPTDVVDYIHVFATVVFMVMLLVIVAGLTGNFLIIYVVVTKPKMVTIHNVHVANLAVIDFLFLGFCSVVDEIGIGYIAFNGSLHSVSLSFSAVLIFAHTLTYTATCGTLIILTIDRYLSIVRPLENKKNRTLKNATMLQGIVWAVSLVFAIVVAALESSFVTQVVAEAIALYGYALLYVCLIVFMLSCIAAIFRSARDQELVEGDRVARWQLRRNMQMLRMVNALVFAFVVCQGVWVGFGLYAHHAGYYHGDVTALGANESLRIDTAVRIVARLACALNSAVNPLIYGTLTADFRKHLRQIILHPFANSRPSHSQRRGTTDSQRQSMMVMAASSSTIIEQ